MNSYIYKFLYLSLSFINQKIKYFYMIEQLFKDLGNLVDIPDICNEP